MRIRWWVYGWWKLLFILSSPVAFADGTQSLPATVRPQFGSIGGRPPKIIEHPTDLIVPKNEPATLQCKADGLPAPSIAWYKDGELISSSQAVFTTKQQPMILSTAFYASSSSSQHEPESPRLVQQNGALHISRVVHNKKGKPDAGIYWCLARNQFGEARSNNASLQVAFLRDDFRRQPNVTRVAMGDNALLECQPPRAYPQPKITWKRDGKDIKLSGRLVLMDEGNLVISDVRPVDGGKYTCVAENLAGIRESHPALLVVYSRPSIIVPPHDMTALAENNVIMECRVTGDPPPTVIWRKNDGRWPLSGARFSILDDGSLRIEHVNPTDEGVYLCQAENLMGSVSATAHLTIHSRPSFLLPPRDQRASLGSIISLDCLTTGNPPPAVFWAKEGSQVLMFPGQPHGRFDVHADGTLIIENAKIEDTGHYTCTALSVAGSAVARVHLAVTTAVTGPPPIIGSGPSNQTLAVNSVAILPCQAIGTPTPSVHWLKDGILLITSNNPRINILDTGTLQLSDLRISDSGIYTCIASSETGETMWSAGLIVESPANPQVMFHRMPDTANFPSAPSKPQILNITQTSIEISWRSGNPEISSRTYRIEYFSYDIPTGWIVVTQSALTTRYTIMNLRPDTSYVFLVRALNPYGLSPPSPLSEPVRTLSPAKPLPDYDLTEIHERFSHNLVRLDAIRPVSSTAVNLHWSVLQNEKYIGGYYVKYRDQSSAENNFTRIKITRGSAHLHTVFELKKYAIYEFSLTPFYKDILGKTSNVLTGQTLEDAPDEPPQNIRVHLVNLTALTVSWDPPTPVAAINGKLAGYRIFVIPTGSSVSMSSGGNSSFVISQVRNISVDHANINSQVIGNLTTGMRYRITLAARTDAGLGVPSKPIYIRMEPYVAGTVDLLQEPWFLGALGGVILLLLVTLLVTLRLPCFMMLMRRKQKTASYPKPDYHFGTPGVAIPFHPCTQATEHGTLLPNSIVGLCRHPLTPGCHHTDMHNPGTPSWMRCEGDWAKQACQLNNAMFVTCNESMGSGENTTMLRTERGLCPVHGHVNTSHVYTEKRQKRHSGTLEKPSESSRLISHGNSAVGTETGNSSTSSNGHSYPETASVHSQRSTPLSQRSDKRRGSGPNVTATPVNWADLLPPPPGHPPPERCPLNSCEEESDNFTALDYKCNKHRLRSGRYYEDGTPSMECDGKNGRKSSGESEIVTGLPPLKRRPPRGNQASLDRAQLYGHRYPNRNSNSIRNSLILQLMPNNLARARSCESSIGNDEENGIFADGSSENEFDPVEYIDDGVNSETSPCLSSEASFFLDRDFSQRNFPDTNALKSVRERAQMFQTIDHAPRPARRQPIPPVAGPRHKLHGDFREPSQQDHGLPKRVRRTRARAGPPRARSDAGTSRSHIGVMTLPVDRAERSLSKFKEPQNRPKKIYAKGTVDEAQTTDTTKSGSFMKS